MECRMRSLLTTIFFLRALETTLCAVSWNLDTSVEMLYEPRFGKSVRLNCTLTGSTCCLPTSVREWWIDRGSGFQTLVSNGVSADSTKYVEDLELTSNQFNLIIKDFDENDVNFQYKCAHDFDEDVKLLQMSDGLNYIPKSTDIIEITMDLTRTNQLSYMINLTNVYPDPTCTCLFGTSNLTNNLTTTTGAGDVLNFAVLSLQNVAYVCPGEFKITCTIGPYDQDVAQISPCGDGGNGDDNCNVILIILVFFAVSLIVITITFFVVLMLRCKFPKIGKVVIIVSFVLIDVVFEITILWGLEYGNNFKFFKSDSECPVVVIGVVCHLVTLLIEVVKAVVLYNYINKLKKRFFGTCISPESKSTQKAQIDVDDRKTRSEGRSPHSAEDRTEKDAKPEDVMILMHFTLPEGYLVDTWATEKTSSINDSSKYRPSDRGSLCIKAATKTDNGIYQSILKSNDSEQRINAVLHVTERKSVSLVIHPLIWRRLSSKKLKKMSELKDVRHKLSINDDIEMKQEDKSNVSIKSVRWKHNGRGIPSNYTNDDKEVPPLEVIKKDPIDEYHCTVEFSNKKSHVYIFIVKFTGARSGNTREDVIGVPTIMNNKREELMPSLPPIRHTGTTASANQIPESSPVQGTDLHQVTARSTQSTGTEDNT